VCWYRQYAETAHRRAGGFRRWKKRATGLLVQVNPPRIGVQHLRQPCPDALLQRAHGYAQGDAIRGDHERGVKKHPLLCWVRKRRKTTDHHSYLGRCRAIVCVRSKRARHQGPDHPQLPVLFSLFFLADNPFRLPISWFEKFSKTVVEWV
jgi:hypothetical protein